MAKRIKKEEFENLVKSIDTMQNVDDFIKAHKSLIGAEYLDGDIVERNLDAKFLKRICYHYWDDDHDLTYPLVVTNFMNSEYLSDFFKDYIVNNLSYNSSNYEKIKELQEKVKGVHKIGELEASDFNNIISNLRRSTIDLFMEYVYKLESKGAETFLKAYHKAHPYLADDLLHAVNMVARSEFYSGRGVKDYDLNAKQLYGIFWRLSSIKEDYAIEFIKLVRGIELLTASDFIEALQDFEKNGFVAEKTKHQNVHLDGVHGKQRNAVAMAAVLSILGDNESYEVQKERSESIKNTFMRYTKPFRAEYDLLQPNENGFRFWGNHTYDELYDNGFNGLNYLFEVIKSPDGIICQVLDTASVDFKDAVLGRKCKETLVLKANGNEKIVTKNKEGKIESTYVTKPGDAIFCNNEDDKYVPRNKDGKPWKFDNITSYGYEIVEGLHKVNDNQAVIVKSTKTAKVLPRIISIPTCIKDAWGKGEHQFLYAGAALKQDPDTGKVTGIDFDAFNETWEILPPSLKK